MTDVPKALVESDWLEARLGDPKVRIVSLNSTNSKNFDAGHIPGAVYWDWKSMLWDPLTRDFPSAEAFASRCAAAGITNDTTVVFYGDPGVQFGVYGWWVFKYCGHNDARVLNGSRMRWEHEGRPMTDANTQFTTTNYTPNSSSSGASMRVLRDEVLASIGREDTMILDHRSPEEYRGELLSPPGTPNHGAERHGHIPSAKHLHFEDFLKQDGSFKSGEEIRAMLETRGATPDKNIISYCKTGHRAALAYFAMTELIGYTNVRSYDGSWTEWGSAVGVPVAR